jgi:hypothetical protein
MKFKKSKLFYEINNMQKFQPLNKVKNIITLFCTVIVLIFFSGLISCQKVINIDLNSPSPQLVVEADISDKPGPYFVRLSKTVNLDEITKIPPVTGAMVEISDSSSGISENLIELKDGIYMTSSLSGIPGHRYKLTIKADGQVYDAVSGMPFPVGSLKLDIKREINNPDSFVGNSGDQAFRYRVNYEINDPVEFTNYYRFVIYHKNRELRSRRVFNDQFHNGKIIADDFVLHDTINFDPGDTVRIELQNIDRNTFNFFRTLREGAGGLSFLSASPSNPISNISRNGLGYFSAYSQNTGYLIIPQ